MPAWEAEARTCREAIQRAIGTSPSWCFFKPGAVEECIRAVLAAAFAEGVKSRTSERVCAEGHAQDPLWSACFICTAYDNGVAAGQQAAADHIYNKVSHVCGYSYGCEDCLRRSIAAALRATGGGT